MSEELITTPHVPAASIVLVSGCSRGLGLSIVEDLLNLGITVVGFARTITPELTALASAHPDSSYFASVDITDVAACKAFVSEVEQRHGVIDALVNNAAIGQDSLHVHTSPERIEQIIQVNLTSPLILTRLVLRRMLAKGRKGRLVNITSICGQRGYPGLVAYSATKGGMDAATRSIAREFSGRVVANAVAPGFFASEMSAVLGQTQLDQILRRTPSGRLTVPEDVLPIVRTLLLETTNINGQSIVIDGAGSI